MKKMKHMIAGTAAGLLAAVLLVPVPSYAVSAQKAVVTDAATGTVLFNRDADSRSLIASTTKIMTALIVCQRCNVLDRMKIPAQAVGIEGSSMYLQEGEVLTLQELLYGLMLSSGNDAAVALALYCGGTVEGFTELMNDKARELGLKHTHFANPNGLDAPDHYSTAADLAVLAAYAMENPIFAMTVSTKTVKAGNRYLRNHNKLLWMVEGVDGVKTGYTKAAGRILVSSAQRQGRRLVAVTIQAPNDWEDHKYLLNRGFSEYENKTLVKSGREVMKAPVSGGEQSEVSLVATEDFSCSLRSGEKPGFLRPGMDYIYAPVVGGTDAGWVYVILNGKAMGKIPVVYGETVEMKREEKKPFWKRW